MRLKGPELLSRLNSSYWFVPLLVTIGGIVAALLLLTLDSRIALDPNSPFAMLRPSSPEGARSLLSAVIGAMITAISVTFSVTIVALTVAAQHFGPRVMRNFVGHTSAQVVLGTFLATFAYSVLVLGAIQGSDAQADVPELAASGAVILVVMSIGALIYYVHYVSSSLQVGELAAEIAGDFRHSTVRLDDGADGELNGEPADIPEVPEDAATISAVETGYVQRVDYRAIVRMARVREAVVWIRREPGAFLLTGTPLAFVHPAGACDEAFVSTVREACIVGRDRTLWHDSEFAVKQLVEVALRALSPGVNEPFTAITCIDRLTEGLACVLNSPPPRSCWPDGDGHPRVFARPQTFTTLLRAAFDPIRIFAGVNPAIYVRLLESVAELALLAERPADCNALQEQAAIMRRAAEAALTDPVDRAYFESRDKRVAPQLRGRATATRPS